MVLLKMCLDIIMRIFEYILGTSREANVYVGGIGGFFFLLVIIAWYSLC